MTQRDGLLCWSRDPLLVADRQAHARLVPALDGGVPTVRLDYQWFDIASTYATVQRRLGNPHLVSADAIVDPETGAWKVRAWAVAAVNSDPALMALAVEVARADEPAYTGILAPSQPRKYRHTQPVEPNPYSPLQGAERVYNLLLEESARAALVVAYSDVLRLAPGLSLKKISLGRGGSVTGLWNGYRFTLRAKGQRATLYIRDIAPGPDPLWTGTARLDKPQPFFDQVEGVTPALKIVEALRLTVAALAPYETNTDRALPNFPLIER
jgi:hypothetical protein